MISFNQFSLFRPLSYKFFIANYQAWLFQFLSHHSSLHTQKGFAVALWKPSHFTNKTQIFFLHTIKLGFFNSCFFSQGCVPQRALRSPFDSFALRQKSTNLYPKYHQACLSQTLFLSSRLRAPKGFAIALWLLRTSPKKHKYFSQISSNLAFSILVSSFKLAYPKGLRGRPLTPSPPNMKKKALSDVAHRAFFIVKPFKWA